MRLFWLAQIIVLTLVTSACSNQFEHKKAKWKQISQSRGDEITTVYIDENRVESVDDTRMQAWVKFIFGKEKQIPFNGQKKGEVSGFMLVKRMDSSVRYNCQTRMSTIISYQLYDAKDKMFDAKWIDFEPEYAQKGTLHGDILKYLCK